MSTALGKPIGSHGLWEFPVDEFLVLARPGLCGLYLLSPSARLVWEILNAGVPLQELIGEFASTYGISIKLAEEDVTRTLDEWRAGLLSERPVSAVREVAAGPRALPSGGDFLAQDYVILGTNVRIILQTPELIEEVAPRLEPLRVAPSAPDLTFEVVEDPDGFRIYCDGYCLATEEGVCEIRIRLLQEIVRRCRNQDCLAILHAGACGSDSRCVVFPAGTQSGKTTLAAVLMKMGLKFYSDDSVILERDTLSVPLMPFSMMVREGSWEVLTPRFPELQEFPVVTRNGQQVRFLPPTGTTQSDHCEQVGAIVFVRFDPDASTEINALDSLQTLLRLQESGFWVAHDEQSIHAFLAWIQSRPSFTLSYSDVDEAASVIRRLIV